MAFESADDLAAAAEVVARAEELRVQLVDVGLPPLLAQEVLDLCQSTKPGWGFCPDCRRKVQADFPDGKSRLAAIQLALGYLVGKPKERKEVDITVSQKPLHEMTDAELEQAARVALTSGD